MTFDTIVFCSRQLTPDSLDFSKVRTHLLMSLDRGISSQNLFVYDAESKTESELAGIVGRVTGRTLLTEQAGSWSIRVTIQTVCMTPPKGKYIMPVGRGTMDGRTVTAYQLERFEAVKAQTCYGATAIPKS